MVDLAGKSSERGVLGVLNVPAGTPLPGDVAKAKNRLIWACAALVTGFLAATGISALRSALALPLVNVVLAAAAMAYFASAFVLCNRLVASRSPALCVLASTFLFTGMLALAQTLEPVSIGAWLWFYSQAGIAIGLVAFAAVDRHWAGRQRYAALRGGYYSNDRPRYVRLTAGAAARWILWAVVVAIVAALATISASGVPSRPLGFAQAQHLAAAAGVVIVCSSLALSLLPASRTSMRALSVALLVGGFIFLAWWTPRLLGSHDALAIDIAAFVAAIMLLSPGGHVTVFRWAMASVAVATLLGGLAALLWPSSLPAAPALAYVYGFIAALVPLSLLLFDAKGGVYAADELARAIRTSAVVDDIFGLPSYQSLMSHLERQIVLADASGVGFTLLIVDIHGVKRINVALGRHAGNELIALTSRVLRAAFDPTGLVARIRGDEFAVLLAPGSKPETTSIRPAIAKALARELDAITPFDLALHVDAFHYDPFSPRGAAEFLRACHARAGDLKKASVPVRSQRLASTT